METELRRNQSTLRILGMGMIAFALWDFIKPALVLLLVSQDWPEADALEKVPKAAVILIVILIFLFVLLSISLRLWIGLSARAEGLGKPRGKAYVVLAFVFLAFQSLLLAATMIQLFRGGLPEQSVLETAASVLLEICSAGTVGELAFTAVKVKKLSVQLQGGR